MRAQRRPAMKRMAPNITVTNPQKAAAILAAAYTVQSDEIETNRQIAKLYCDIHAGVRFEDDFSLIASILISGRLMDMKAPTSAIPSVVGPIVESVRRDIMDMLCAEVFGRGEPPVPDIMETYRATRRDTAAAFLASAYVRMTPRIESLKETVRFYNNLRSLVSAGDDLSYIGAILLSGRVAESKTEQGIVDQMGSSVAKLAEQIRKRRISLDDSPESMARAMLVSAYVAHSPGLETYSQIADLYQNVGGAVAIRDDLDVVSLILVSGKVQDASSTVEMDRLNDNIQIIKTSIRKLAAGGQA